MSGKGKKPPPEADVEEGPRILALPLAPARKVVKPPLGVVIPEPLDTRHGNGTYKKGIKRDQHTIVRIEQRKCALQLRRRGYSSEEIAVLLQVSVKYAQKLVVQAIRRSSRTSREDVAEVCQLELDRIDLAVKRIMDQIEDETSSPTIIHQAIDRLVALQRRRAELLHLDGSAEARLPMADEHARTVLAPVIDGATQEELLQMRAIFAAAAERKKVREKTQRGYGSTLGEPAS